MSRIGEMQAKLIQVTGEPFAPILVNDLYSAIKRSKPLFPCEQEEVKSIQERLMKDFPDPELNSICHSPAFITALCIMLQTSVTHFVRTKVNP